MAPGDSPLFAPANAAENDAFSEALAQVIADDIYPAMQRYRDYLVDEYHDEARTEISVAALPNGEACYVAQLRTYTTLPYQPEEMFNYLYAEKLTYRKRALTTQEVADAVVYLLSPRSSGINAQGIVVNAGMDWNYFDEAIVERVTRSDSSEGQAEQ